jgi:hypothetical protein
MSVFNVWRPPGKNSTASRNKILLTGRVEAAAYSPGRDTVEAADRLLRQRYTDAFGDGVDGWIRRPLKPTHLCVCRHLPTIHSSAAASEMPSAWRDHSPVVPVPSPAANSLYASDERLRLAGRGAPQARRSWRRPCRESL